MNKLYIFNYSDTAGSREDVKKWLDQEEKVTTWRYDLPHCFYVISKASASELSKSFIQFNGKKGRHLFAEITDNRQGLLTTKSWSVMRMRRYTTDDLTVNDLLYKDEYVDTATDVSDDPKVIMSDSKRLNRNEKYEVLHFLNALTGKNNSKLNQKVRRICEWMIHEHLPSDIQSTKKIRTWIADNYVELSKSYPHDD
ncbi:hypothetical protein OGY01_12750 [Citrobacter sp. Cm038]|uniref:hypothetical protein n=1 Tax=Citrobacter sp. Cm038 TaxID=2985117 RepID=UPI0025785CDE|nr:hypothetical protein [Citrobacter sp. Cm038]MDM2943307.1 hypothetical protein [Citrobacter sp. Cm038]